MNVKVYFKVGKKNYKEAKLVDALQQAVARKIQTDPDFANEFKPAKNFDELQKLYDKYVITDVEFTELPAKTEKSNENKNYEEHKQFREGMKENLTKEDEIIKSQIPKKEESNFSDDADFIDPLNREEPLVRDYVMSDNLSGSSQSSTSGRTDFAEPLTFQEAFEIPSGDNDTPRVTSNNANPTTNNTDNGRNNNTNQNNNQNKQPRPQPLNPNFDDMSNAKKRKSTRKFAKYIVETVCMLSEKGFVWFANKDINEAKLAEYELNNEMDLDLLVTLEDGQQATVKQFFQVQCYKAEQLAKIPQEEKEDLAEALAEVLLEKGVGPTPIQELMLISLKIFGGQVVNLIALKSQTNSLLAQLRTMKQQEMEAQGYTQPQYTQRAAPQEKPSPEYKTPTPPPTSDLNNLSQEEKVQDFDSINEDYNKIMEEEEQEVKKILDTPIETKE